MWQVRRRFLREESGFTLPELMVTMMVMLTVFFALHSIFDMSIRVFSFGNDKTEATENARLGLERMEREIRAAYPVDKANNLEHVFFSASGATVAPSETMPSSDQITFGNDLNGDKRIDCNPSGAAPGTAAYTPCEYITYRVASTNPTLLRNNKANGSDAASGGEPVVEFVDGLEFQYLDREGDPCGGSNPDCDGTDEGEIRMVRISLTTEVDRGLSDPTAQTLTTDVALRNRTN